MGKKGKTPARKALYDWLGKKWEGIRRRQDYKANYRSYRKKCNRKYKDRSISYSEYIAYRDKACFVSQEKYGMARPFDPEISYFKLKENIGIKDFPPSREAINSEWGRVYKECEYSINGKRYDCQGLLRPGENYLKPESYLVGEPETPYFLCEKYPVLRLEFLICNFSFKALSVITSRVLSKPEDRKDGKPIGVLEVAIDFSAPLPKIMYDLHNVLDVLKKEWHSSTERRYHGYPVKSLKLLRKKGRILGNDCGKIYEVAIDFSAPLSRIESSLYTKISKLHGSRKDRLEFDFEFAAHIFDSQPKTTNDWRELVNEYRKEHHSTTERKYLTRLLKKMLKQFTEFVNYDCLKMGYLQLI